MSALISRMRHASIPVLAPLAFGVLTACGSDRDSRLDDQMRADLQAASQAMPMRGQFASPTELGYPQGYAPMPGYQGYAPYPGTYPANYPQPYGYPQPAQQRVVYAPAPAPVRRSGTVGTSGSTGSGRVVQEQRNTQKGAIIGAATGAAIGVATSRDRVKGAAIGALGGAVLGGVIGHQVKTPR